MYTPVIERTAMRIVTTARHCVIDPEDRLFTEQQLEKLLRFAPDLTEAHVTVSAENYRYTAEITVRIEGREFIGRETGDALRTALSEAAIRLEHQVRKLKDRRLDRRRGDRTRAADAMGIPGETEGGEDLGGAAWED
jgi:ribosomal subunit interface protein